MPLSKLRPSFTLTEDRLKELQAVLPEAFADGKINWDALREALGETLEDEAQEHFGLFWPGKREARRLATMPSKGTLIPQPGEGVDQEHTHNLFIEGDNLEVLKLLQKSYAGRIKMIYIDPPYNTGNDFVYPDDYSEPLDVYLERTGQVDELGQLLTTNSRVSGRFHSNWMNMIYPRLLLARQLLRDDGVIFVSIDDNEFHNLRQIMGEIFGDENFVANICWEKADSPKMDSDYFSIKHDYIVCFAKNIISFEVLRKGYTDDNIPEHYNKVDENGRKYYLKPLRAMGGQGETREARPNLYYAITAPNGKGVYPKLQGGGDGAWRWSRKKLEDNLSRIEWVNKGTDWTPYFRIYADESTGKPPETMLFSEDVGSNRTAIADLKKLFGDVKYFDTPKPVELIKHLIRISARSNDLVMDFFAGSCTTAQSVLELNGEDNGTRPFIMVQLPEPTPMDSAARKDGYKTISQIGMERIRRVLKNLSDTRKNELNLYPNQDYGCKCFTLSASNYTEWEPYSGKDTQQLELHLGKAETPLIEGWTSENLLAEILLLQGFPLDSRVHSLPEFKGNDVQQVASEFVTHPLYVCLDKKIKPETVSKLKLGSEDIFVCLDSALSDEVKVKLADQCNLKVI